MKILTDVDGVLLEWENHFIQWMLKRSHFVRGKRRQTYKLLPNKEREYAMEKRFGINLARGLAQLRVIEWGIVVPMTVVNRGRNITYRYRLYEFHHGRLRSGVRTRGRNLPRSCG